GQVHPRHEQPLLRAEVVVHEGRVNAGPPRDAPDRRPVVAELTEQLAGRRQDPRARAAVAGRTARPSRSACGHATSRRMVSDAIATNATANPASTRTSVWSVAESSPAPLMSTARRPSIA